MSLKVLVVHGSLYIILGPRPPKSIRALYLLVVSYKSLQVVLFTPVSSSGIQKWAFEMAFGDVDPVTLGADGTVFLHGPEERSLHALSKEGTEVAPAVPHITWAYRSAPKGRGRGWHGICIAFP